MHFRVFFKVKVRNGEYFFSCLNLNFLFGGGGGGCLKFLIFFIGGGVNGRCCARAYVWRKNESTPRPRTVA